MGGWKTIAWQGIHGSDVFKTAIIFAEIVAENGHYAQAFPDFRYPAACSTNTAYNRISDQPIRIRSHVEKADIIVVLNPNSGQLQWQELAHEGTTYIFNCDSIEKITNVMDIDEKNILYVDVESTNSQMENGDLSLPLLLVVVKNLDLMAVEKFSEDLEKILAKQWNAEQVSLYLHWAAQVVAGVKTHE